MVVELEPDSSDADHCPDAGSGARSNLVRLKDSGKNISFIGAKAENSDELLPRFDLLFHCEADKEYAQAVVEELDEALVEKC